MFIFCKNSSSNEIIFNLCLICILYVSSVQSRCENARNEREVIQELFSTYKKQLPRSNSRLNENGEYEEDPVYVTVEMHIQDISSLNEITSDFEIDILFSQVWHDSGLKFEDLKPCKKNITMETKKIADIWTPNTCIFNSKKSTLHVSPTDNIMFMLYDVRMSSMKFLF